MTVSGLDQLYASTRRNEDAQCNSRFMDSNVQHSVWHWYNFIQDGTTCAQLLFNWFVYVHC